MEGSDAMMAALEKAHGALGSRDWGACSVDSVEAAWPMVTMGKCFMQA